MQRCAGKMHELGLYMYRCWILYCTCDIRIYVSNVYMYMCTHECLLWGGYTSSTAQGGGGSFKNRKPIGEVGCRKSRMAERINWWTERWLECRTIYLPIYPSIHLSVYLPICLFIAFSLHVSIYLPIRLVVCLVIYYLCIYLSIYLSFHLSAWLSICLCSRVSIKLPVCVDLSIFLPFFPVYPLSRSIHFLVYLSVFPLVIRSMNLSSCLSAHPAAHSIHFSTEAFHPHLSGSGSSSFHFSCTETKQSEQNRF